MKKKTVIIGLAFITIAMLGVFTACSTNSNLAEPEQIFHITVDDVAKIEVASGTTGNRVYIENREDIARIIEEMNNMQYIKKETFELRIGWSLMITLYDNDNNEITRFLPRGNETLEVGEWRYTLVNPHSFNEMFIADNLG